MDVIELKDTKVISDNYYPYEHFIRTQNIPIVIDNGSYKCRAGWSVNEEPLLIFRNLLARPRKDRGRKDGETQIGNDIANIEAVRFQLKSQFDRNAVTQFEVQEQIFDYIFAHLGIDTEGSVNHPVFLTEPLLNPNYCRMKMAELLFEGYRVQGICYGIDSVFSFMNEQGMDYKKLENCHALIVSCGHQCTHLVPIVNGSVDICKCKRIDVGGYHIMNYAYKLLQLKYPAHLSSITCSKAETLVHDYSYVATNYAEEISRWTNVDYYEQNVKRIQLPYVVTTVLTPDQQREKRKEFAKKLVELNAKKRQEKLVEDEETLTKLEAKQAIIMDSNSSHDVQTMLRASNVSSISDLSKKINLLQTKIEKTKKKMMAGPVKEPVIEVPKIKALKNIIELPKDNEDIKPWLHEIYKKRLDLLEKRHLRRQKRQDMTKRGTKAAQERMRLISQLARQDKFDDDFGYRDEDWDVYKAINKENGDSDSEEEQEQLTELEELLKYYDPMYTGNNTPPHDPMNTREAYQLHFGLERSRVPEILFQPSMIGCGQAGIASTMEFLLNSYDADTADRLANNVLVTGGPAQISGFVRRLETELLQMRPFESRFRVQRSMSPNLGAWYGARKFASDDENVRNYIVTYEDYVEKGADYLKEHFASNPYVQLPEQLPAESVTSVIDCVEIDEKMDASPINEGEAN